MDVVGTDAETMSPDEEHYIGYTLTDVARLLRTVFERRVRSLGLTRAQWVVIARIYRHPGLSQTEVADLLEIEKATAGRLIDRMELKGWLERSAGMFNQITPGEADQVLLNPDFPSYNFDVIDGVSYEIDLSEPSKFDRDGNVVNAGANRIRNLMYQGQPVTPDMEFVIATNNYRASGGGSFPGAKGDTIIFEGPDTNRDVIVRYIVEQGTINPSADANWTFAPMEGTTVLFDTGPAAQAYASEVPGVEIAPAGEGPDGFARFRISL